MRPPLGTAHVIRGNALNLPLDDGTVDLIVTSPPYFGLRSYQDGGEHYAGQIGAEATPAQFVDALLKATAEMVRVLKPSGSIWVNLGDKYAVRTAGRDVREDFINDRSPERRHSPYVAMNAHVPGRIREKSLIGIPWRYAIRCIDDLGLILRAEVIWSKPNGLPESVTDRVRRSHETWFHFTKAPRYFSAVDEIREATGDYSGAKPRTLAERTTARKVPGNTPMSGTALEANPLGKLPGSVWSIPTQPLRVPVELGVDHFAAFPMEFPRRIVQGWSPPGVCTGCGEGRRPVTAKTHGGDVSPRTPVVVDAVGHKRHLTDHRGRPSVEVAVTGYACACPDTTAPTTPAVILDPFGGTGTTALVAKALGRTGITVDMSADYSRLATWRTNDPRELAAALQVDAPSPVAPDQLDLLDGLLA